MAHDSANPKEPNRRERVEPKERRDEFDEYEELDADTVTDDAIDYFADEPGDADSPAADTNAPPPG